MKVQWGMLDDTPSIPVVQPLPRARWGEAVGEAGKEMKGALKRKMEAWGREFAEKLMMEGPWLSLACIRRRHDERSRQRSCQHDPCWSGRTLPMPASC